MPTDRVFLLPGFLGFDNLGDFDYFRDAVRDELVKVLSPARFEIDALETDPAGSLAFRQHYLLTQLQRKLAGDAGARVHLVGHSTGGLDAELLLRTPMIDRTSWQQSGYESVRRAIRSVTTIAAPLAGTTLADSSVAKLGAIDLRDWTTVQAALKTNLTFRALLLPGKLLKAVALLPFVDSTARDAIASALRRDSGFATFTLRLLLRRALISDLQPSRVLSVLRERAEDPTLDVSRFRVLTVAARNPSHTPAGALFDELYDVTAQAAKTEPTLTARAQQLTAKLRAEPQLLISGSAQAPGPFTAGTSDAIVNTLRQLLPSYATAGDELDRLLAVVVADHIDVIGYFEGANGSPNGFLSSGSMFRQAEFQQLYAVVAQAIASVP